MEYHCNSQLQGQKFKFVCWVAALTFIQRAASISNHMFFSINALIEDHPQADPTGISVGKVCKCQNRGSAMMILNSSISCIHSSLYACFMVILFSLHKMMQNQSLPSFVQTRTIAKDQGIDEDLIAPTSNICVGAFEPPHTWTGELDGTSHRMSMSLATV